MRNATHVHSPHKKYSMVDPNTPFSLYEMRFISLPQLLSLAAMVVSASCADTATGGEGALSTSRLAQAGRRLYHEDLYHPFNENHLRPSHRRDQSVSESFTDCAVSVQS